MGLFSFLNKNKQEAGGDDDGQYVSRDDDALAAKARSKRASSANEPGARRSKEGRAAVDPVLPEKKRARRRLVGAIALALAVAIGLPMILDSEPKPLATNIDIRIPSKEKAPPQQLPAPESAAAPVPAGDALDKSEEIVDPVSAQDVAQVRAAAAAEKKPEPRLDIMPEPRIVEKPPVKVAEAKPAERKPEPKPEAKPDNKPETKLETKPAAKPDTERALAILEDKPEPAPSNQKYVIQVVALSNPEKVSALQEKLKAAGVPSFTQKGTGDMVRVKVGPFSKDESDQIRAKLVKLGLSGAMVPN